MSEIHLNFAPGDYIVANNPHSQIANITRISIGIRSRIVIYTESNGYYPIEYDSTINILRYEDYACLECADRFQVDYIVGSKEDLMGIRWTAPDLCAANK